MNLENMQMSREGWICPKCGVVHSPDVKTCHCAKDNKDNSNISWPNTLFPPRPDDVVGKCSKCGLELHSVMGYVCRNHPCPTGLGGASYGPTYLTE